METVSAHRSKVIRHTVSYLKWKKSDTVMNTRLVLGHSKNFFLRRHLFKKSICKCFNLNAHPLPLPRLTEGIVRALQFICEGNGFPKCSWIQCGVNSQCIASTPPKLRRVIFEASMPQKWTVLTISMTKQCGQTLPALGKYNLLIVRFWKICKCH